MNDSHPDLPHFAHPAPVKLLVGVFITLVILTIATLGFASMDFGLLQPFKFWVAMIIATAKAALVMMFFMHMYWDKPMNVVVFLSGTLFVMLFIGLTLMDYGHYKDSIDKFPREDAVQNVQLP